MSLLTLPHELLLEIMEHLRDSQDKKALQCIASTCKVLHGMAEACLYSSAVFTTKSSFNQFLKATSIDQRRSQYLQELSLAFSSSRYEYNDEISRFDLSPFDNLRSLFSESPECQPWARKSTVQWKVYMDIFMRLFEKASLLNKNPDTHKPLQNLESLTLHWSGTHSRCWAISPACPIFLLPQLRSLEISCASIGQVVSGPVVTWDEEFLRKFSHQTNLKSLALIECTVSVEAFDAILSLPAALQRLTLYETSHHEVDVLYDRFATADSDLFNRALAQQCDSLAYLAVMACPSYASLPGNISRPLLLALGDFRALTHLRLGPFRAARRGSRNGSIGSSSSSNQPDLCGLKHPPPPALTSLRLDDFLLSLLTPRAASEVLAELLVDDLVAGAKARGAALELDIALAHMTAYLQRLQRIRDQRPLVRKLVQGFADNFHQRQPQPQPQPPRPAGPVSGDGGGGGGHARVGSGSSSSSSASSSASGLGSDSGSGSGSGSDADPDGASPGASSSSDNTSKSECTRLRILTSKRVRVIPPYLHAEKRPRYVVRYDSWHPHRFVPDAHVASVDYFDDDDISSEDEDVEAAFQEQ